MFLQAGYYKHRNYTNQNKMNQVKWQIYKKKQFREKKNLEAQKKTKTVDIWKIEKLI